MDWIIRLLKVCCICLGVASLTVAALILFDEAYFNTSLKIDSELAAKFGDFFGGFIGTIFAIFSVILLIYTIVSQHVEMSKNGARDRFFKMLDYHNENIRSIRVPSLETAKNQIIEEGRRAFVVYKIQLKRLLQAVTEIDQELSTELTDAQKIDIAYMCFYYGQSNTWVDFISQKLSCHQSGAIIAKMMLEKVEAREDLKLGRTNQTDLSSYFRNMYNAIKLVDNDKYLSENEKIDLVKIYRAQLSNPELYILFFNLVSRFGKKWNSNGYIEKYEILTNLPIAYCDGYDPKKYFDINFEEDEIEPWAK
ncbi:putative phage abortive infection protein [Pseudomonas veronii]|uniref:putative phage abortive infection protein n=1 Tax=Pseudomonas veronii TaxID=76761 RepID=UPI001E3E5D6B|nr:putative phage abortive infection protein [Pseudomonas veronii]UHH33043.1 putative phage abortive infection protein [Pseudomonas veronii]